MRDDQTRSLWEHTQGECISGPLQGSILEPHYGLEYLTAHQVLAAYPEATIAISRPSLREAFTRLAFLRTMISREGFLPYFFYWSMGEEDSRRERLELGLGVWSARGVRRFYPLGAIRAQDGLLFDSLDQQRVMIYLDPVSGAPGAIYTQAQSARWDGARLVLDTGEFIQNGGLYDDKGAHVPANRPLQIFTRWYGFAFTFPGCQIYGKP